MGVAILNSQDMLYPLQTNHALNEMKTYKKLSVRADSDSVNYQINIIPYQLPFYDDFSRDDKRLPKNVEPFTSAVYYQAGICPVMKGLKMKILKFTFSQTYTDTFNAAKPPFYRDSVPTNPVSLSFCNDTPQCLVCTFPLNTYPATCRYKFNSTGAKIDSICQFDTAVSVAYIKESNFKDILWLDHYSYFNTTYPYMPLSKGVATLDGLNEKGRPYSNPIIFDAYGRADYLTSTKIDLSTLFPSDSVYLSFYYQPQGYGDWPDKKDSLIVEFRDNLGRWNQVFSIKGFSAPIKLDTLTFKAVTIRIPGQTFMSDPIYYYDNFQFRFSNFATLSGNNDHWHIDYVKLDKARTYTDTAINDFTFVYDLPSILKNYTLMPAKQYRGNQDFKDTIIAYNRNIIPNNPILSIYDMACDNVTTSTNYYVESGLPYNTSPLTQFILKPTAKFAIPFVLPDGTVISSKIFLRASGDDFITNDTAYSKQVFGKEMAYDDGSAEMAYGLQGLGLKKIAYKFFVPVIDTLSAIKMMFSNIDVDVSSLVFNIDIWKTIGIGTGVNEKSLATIQNKKPIYFDSLNSFAIFPLDTPLIVQDTIYVGWTQTDELNLQIGYDCNSTLGLPNTYVFVNNTWTKSNVITLGSPMIRLLLDGNYKNSASIFAEVKQKEAFMLFPNPTSDFVTVSSDSRMNTKVVIYNMVGQEVYNEMFHTETKIDVSSFNKGLYLIIWERDGLILESRKLNIY